MAGVTMGLAICASGASMAVASGHHQKAHRSAPKVSHSAGPSGVMVINLAASGTNAPGGAVPCKVDALPSGVDLSKVITLAPMTAAQIASLPKISGLSVSSTGVVSLSDKITVPDDITKVPNCKP